MIIKDIGLSRRRRPGRGAQLTAAERAEVQQLALVDGLSQAEIARRVNRDRGTVASVLAAEDTQHMRTALEDAARSGARAILTRHAEQAAQDWVSASAVARQRGDHRPARDLLLHSGAIEPIKDGRQRGGPQIAIVIGTPEVPIRIAPADAHDD